MRPSAIFFSKSASFSQLLCRTIFLSELNLVYVKLIKVTDPDGTILIKPFNIT